MTLRFILGRAGSGKTRFCLETMIGEEREAPLGPPLIFLVPEQATFQMEKELLQLSRGATCRIQVLSFQRLAFSFKKQGEELLLPSLTETGRQMVLRRLLQQRSAGLKAFGRTARQHRFCEKLSGQLREFKNCLVTPEALTLASCNESLSVPTRAKLADLAVIFTDYLEFIKGQFSDPEDSLSLLASALEADGLPAGTKVWVDGFAGFTPQEYMVIAVLLKTAHHLEIGLCLDPDSVTDNPQENELFYPTLDTYRRLRQISGRTKTAALTPLVLPLKGRAHVLAPVRALLTWNQAF
jgi:ATP-dependent helicase/nuclease subunit B